MPQERKAQQDLLALLVLQVVQVLPEQLVRHQLSLAQQATRVLRVPLVQQATLEARARRAQLEPQVQLAHKVLQATLVLLEKLELRVKLVAQVLQATLVRLAQLALQARLLVQQDLRVPLVNHLLSTTTK